MLPLNGIALQLAPAERHRLEAVCNSVELRKGQVLEPLSLPPAEHPVYFLQTATASLWVEPGSGHKAVAVGLVGCEGLVGCSRLWDNGHGQWVSRVLTAGSASMTTAGQLQALMAESPELVLAMTRFLWRQTQEVVQLSARMLTGDIRTRLALWLHLMQHKTGHDRLHITHESLADMLGTRRVSITLIAGQMQSEGAIVLYRGGLEITDPVALRQMAGLKP